MTERQPLLQSDQHSSKEYVRNGSVGISYSGSRDHVEVPVGSTVPQQQPNNHFRRQSSHVTDISEPVTLSWWDLNAYAVPPSKGLFSGRNAQKSTKHILRHVTGQVTPGTLLAIIGASGAGKSTLMNMLTYRNKGALAIQGSVYVNGVDVGKGIKNISAYVQQDDLFIGTLTVREHLQFRALLRMDKRIPKSERLRKVDEVIQELGLTKCADTFIGTPGKIKGISGGEMKRLSFASEVLTNPPLIFCDEPTSGLDSYMAGNIVQTLKFMVSKGRTILCTIHQPSSEVFEMFDQLLLLAEGRVAYMGPSKEALTFLSARGFQCPVNYNPADFYIQTLAIIPGQENERRRRVEEICDGFDKTPEATRMKESITQLKKEKPGYNVLFEDAFSDNSRYGAPVHQQLRSVFWRSWVTNIRDPMVLRVKTFQTVVIAVLLGLIYLKTDHRDIYTINDVQNVNGVLFLVLINMTMSNVFAVVNSFPLEMPVFFREYGSNLYGTVVYYACKAIAELPQFIIFPFFFTAIIYFMVGLYEDVDSFFYLVAVVIFVANISGSFGYIISAATNSVNVALALAPPLMVPLLLFGGFFLNNNTMPDWLIWLKYLSWFQWSNELAVVNQWQHVGPIYCNNTFTGNDTKAICDSGAAILQRLDFKKDNEALDFAILAGLFVGARLISFLALFIRARRSNN